MSCKCYANKGESSMSFSYNPTCGKVDEGFLYGCSSQSCRNGKGCSKSEPPDDFIGAISSYSSYIITNIIKSDSGSDMSILWLLVVIMIIVGTFISFSQA
jgi:hypothetical protein